MSDLQGVGTEWTLTGVASLRAMIDQPTMDRFMVEWGGPQLSEATEDGVTNYNPLQNGQEDSSPEGSAPLTDEQIDELQSRADRLYELYNACAEARAEWVSNHKQVHDLMAFLNETFPGKDLLLLLREVARLRDRLEDLGVDPNK